MSAAVSLVTVSHTLTLPAGFLPLPLRLPRIPRTMFIQKWIKCSERLPADRWGGKTRFKNPDGTIVQKQCLRHIGGDFIYADSRTGKWTFEHSGPEKVIEWLGVVEEE